MCGAAISSLRLQSRATVAQASACAIPASCRGTIHRARLRLSSNRTSSMQRRAPFSRKHMDLRQEEFARLLRVHKTTLSKWENNEDPIGLQSDLLARVAPVESQRIGDEAPRMREPIHGPNQRGWPGAPGSASLPGRRLYGCPISSCLQMARTVPSLISRWRGTLAILCKVGLNQMLWAPHAI